MKKTKNQNGITLVALVITIIILLILAGISISALTDQGIFAQVNKAKKEAQRAQVTEWLNLKLMEEQMKKPFGTSEEIVEATRTASYGNKELSQMGKKVVVDENTSTMEDGEEVDVYFYVQVDEDVYKVEMSGAKFIGEAGKFPPVITVESLTNTTNSITIKIKVSRNEGGELIIYKKKENEATYTVEKEATGDEVTGLEYTFEGLEQNKNYSIKIVATAKNGQIKEYTKDIPLGGVPELKKSNTTFSYSPVQGTWTNGSVTVTVSTTVTGYTLQTSKDGEIWESTATQTFTENGTVYARLWDGRNAGKAVAGNVTNIDKEIPVIGTVTSTVNSITVNATDTGSGIVGIKVTTRNTAPTSFDSITTTNTLTNKTISGLAQNTTYYVWVKDAVGNVSTSKEIKTQIQYVTSISLNKTSESLNVSSTLTLTATVSPSTANNRNVTWSSNNTSVATVLNGVVTAKTAGTATITATAQDGSGESATCTITVKQPYKSYSIGDEVTVKGEQFYVIADSDSSQSTVTLLAKYNINSSGTAQYSYQVECKFSSTKYWGSNQDLNSAEGYTETDAMGIAKKYGSQMGAVSSRLLTRDEAERWKWMSFDKTVQKYWIGWGNNVGDVWVVYVNRIESYYYTSKMGVRPVITVLKSSIT